MKSTPVLSLVTGTRNRQVSLNRLVISIQKHTPLDFELIISDASDEPISTDGFPLNVRVIPERPRRGCSSGYNIAFHYAVGEWCIWLNDDCEVTPGYATTAIQFMERNPEIGLGALYYSDPNHSGFKINKCSFGMTYANFGILKRSLGDNVGWFDDEITMYGGDNSLTYRVLMAGKGIAGISDARIIHHSENDPERAVNNHMPFRIAQADYLKSKYLPYLAQMRATYERTKLVTA